MKASIEVKGMKFREDTIWPSRYPQYRGKRYGWNVVIKYERQFSGWVVRATNAGLNQKMSLPVEKSPDEAMSACVDTLNAMKPEGYGRR